MLFDSIAYFFFFCDANIRHIHVWRFQHFLMLYFAYSISSAKLFFFFFSFFECRHLQYSWLEGQSTLRSEDPAPVLLLEVEVCAFIHSFSLSLSLSLSFI
jgi:hypothetical protein